MEDISYLIQERNAHETSPFLSVYASNAYLRNYVDTLQERCESLERQYLEQQQLVAEQQQAIEHSFHSAPAKAEARLRDQISKLQEELRLNVQKEVKTAAEAMDTYNQLSACKENLTVQETTITNLQVEASRNNEIIIHLQSEISNSESLVRLANKQIDGLKDAIRSLQDENDELSKLNKRILNETVSDKEKMAEQLNNMNDTIEALQKEVNMLRSYAKMGKGPIGNWFGNVGRSTRGEKQSDSPVDDDNKDTKQGRQWEASACTAVIPSQPQFTIKAHRDDAVCVRYDGTNMNRVATASSDANVKVFNTNNGQLEATFSAGGGHPLIGVDIAGDIVCGCGADKTCRVWNYQSKRMIHQLAGHSQKITCVRLFPGHKSIVTGSADRSIRIWDISRHVYTQTTTFRHSSTSNCCDVSLETQTVISGHLDGGIRFWDARTGDRVLDIPSLHEGGVTCVQWKPGNSNEVLTNGKDSTLKVIDTRKSEILHTFRDPSFRTLTNHASCSFSPDGKYALAGSGDSGDIFVWNIMKNGDKEKQITAHACGVVGVAWGMGGTNGQQVASVDKSGVLILWA